MAKGDKFAPRLQARLARLRERDSSGRAIFFAP
jgi:hypothetical protein